MAQWWRICFPMQETWVPSVIWEDPTCHGATKPLSHNYWSCAVLSSPAAPTEACMPLSLWPPTEDPLGWEAPTLQREMSPDSSQLEKPHIPVKTHTANNKSIFFKRGKSRIRDRFYFPRLQKSLHTVTAVMKLKDACFFQGKLWQT